MELEVEPMNEAEAEEVPGASVLDLPAPPKLETQRLSAWFGAKQALHEVSLQIPPNAVTAIIGPSGCGKSTYLRCLNRMHELVDGARVEGRVLLDGENVYEQDPMRIRRRIGMVFQRANPFPTMSIYANVAAGLRFAGMRDPDALDRAVERSLRRAALWEEVEEDVWRSGTSLSGGQQQRLCIARALAVDPEVLLMDEPASALDPIATAKIEDLIFELRKEMTIVIVTHNMQQAARVADFTAFLYLGKLIEFDRTRDLFEKPKESLTENYITGRFG
ncbi:MAG TPA: phosphate ABC transporter ATP-binding protein PstB [Thermoplasmata archaeon]|jgi:phosphate transport system ATP-binding protein|nr:phosphate ABC transporter ATP-binding protein PstB [Thermoplasmata archaeon]